MSLTTDPKDPDLGHGSDKPGSGMNKKYLVLSDEEIARGFVQPCRRTYIHKKCRTSTTMGQRLAETYAVDPWFYGATYCVHCGHHPRLEEFTWDDGEEMAPHLWSEAQAKRVQDAIALRDAKK